MTNIKTIVISGGTRGIGLSIAQKFAAHGWQIVTAARTEKDIEQMKTHWKEKYPNSPLHCFMFDLSTKEGCHAFTSNIKEQINQLEVLVNNVGQFAPGTLLEGDENQLDYFLDTNLLSAHYLTRGLYSLFSNNKLSHLFTIGSIAADDWPPAMASYALSKECLHAWHKGVSEELTKKQTAHSTLIIPGATYTSSWHGIDIDPNSLLTPEAVAQVVWENWESKDERKRITIVKT